MLKRTGTMALMAVLTVAFLTSCGGLSPTPTTTTTSTKPAGSLITLVGDTPGLCDVVSYTFSITHLSLIGPYQVGTVPINSNSLSEPQIRINLGCLRDFTTPLNLSSANVGTFNTAYITLIEPDLFFYDPTILPPNPPINIPNFTMNPLKNIQIPVNPPLVVSNGAASVLQIDFDVAHMIESITTNPTTGKLTVTATPEITMTPITAAGSQGQGFGVLDDLVGFVRSVTIPPPNNLTLYDGSFNLQLLSASVSSPPVATINLNSSSQLYGFSNLNQLVTDSVMEVDAYIDVDGNFVATSVENEYTESLPPLGSSAAPTLALIGPIISLTRDSNGNATTFNLWARDVEPPDLAAVNTDTMVTVNLSPQTIYQYSSRSSNFANLPFGPGNFTLGQEVIVHGLVTVPKASSGSGAPTLPTTVTAFKVYDKLQSFQGGFSSLVQVAGDDKTGAFTFNPCGVMFQGTPAMVLTNNQTAFVNLTGLSAITGQSGQPTLLVKGLPFYEAQAQTIYGVPVPAGTLVIIAKQVHQLQ
jgi:hypothetical protein